MSAAPTTPPPATTPRLRWALADGLAVARRNLTHVRHVPEKLLDVTLQPIMFVLLFAYVFGGVHRRSRRQLPRVPHGRHLRPDPGLRGSTAPRRHRRRHAKGIVDRFRSLPMARSAVLSAATLADLATAARPDGPRRHRPGGRLAHPRGVARHGRRLRPAPALRLRDELARHAPRPVVRSPEAAQGVVFIVDLPADVRRQHVRAHRRHADRAAASRRVEPHQRRHRRLRDLFGNPRRSRPTPSWPLEHPVLAALLWSSGSSGCSRRWPCGATARRPRAERGTLRTPPMPVPGRAADADAEAVGRYRREREG